MKEPRILFAAAQIWAAASLVWTTKKTVGQHKLISFQFEDKSQGQQSYRGLIVSAGIALSTKSMF